MRAWSALALASLLACGCLGSFGGPRQVEPTDYLTSSTYTKWVVEVDAASGALPSQSVLDFARGRVAPLVHKDSVSFQVDERSLPSGSTTWSDKDLEDLAAAHQGTKTNGDTVVTHLLFVSGSSEHDSGSAKVLGITYNHDLVVLFSDSIRNLCSLPGQILCNPDVFFESVLVHEFGHALGLVDNGVPMVHPHEAASCNNQPDKHHSSNTGSVMTCAVESSGITLLGNNPPNDYDADDRADLKAAGGA